MAAARPALALFGAVALLGATAAAQAPVLPAGAGTGPVAVEADQGIEWRRDIRAYIARGNAHARQGDVAVRADVLVAHYREAEKGGATIFRFDAQGNVRITAPGQTATGDTAVYDLDQSVLVLRGGNLRLVTEDERITARDSLEYWDQRKLAVARGNVLVVRDDKRIRADVLTAHFATGKDGKTRLARIDLFDNVHVSTPCEIARAERGVYDLGTSVAKLTGSVKITRGASQLDGEYAEVNLNTGVSRIYGGKGVRGLFTPADLKGAGGRCATAAPGG